MILVVCSISIWRNAISFFLSQKLTHVTPLWCVPLLSFPTHRVISWENHFFPSVSRSPPKRKGINSMGRHVGESVCAWWGKIGKMRIRREKIYESIWQSVRFITEKKCIDASFFAIIHIPRRNNFHLWQTKVFGWQWTHL